jgi:Na+/H+ antiporter NhaC
MACAAGLWGLLHELTPPPATGFGAAAMLPALVAVAIAIATHRVIIALAVGVVVGAIIAAGSNPLNTFEILYARTVGPAATDKDNLLVVGFALALVAMVRVMTTTRALHRLMHPFTRLARSRRGAKAAAAGMGTAIFFDDYANALVVGAAARPLTDAHKVSREKLAWLVDATSAPIAGLVVVSTWIAYEIKLIEQSGVTTDGFDMLVTSLPYRFYCIFTIAFVWMMVLAGRDFGPMLKAERRAFHEGRPAPGPASAKAHAAEPTPRETAWSGWLALAAIGAVIAGGLASALGVFDDALLLLFLSSLVSLAIAIGGAAFGRLLDTRALLIELRNAAWQILPLLLILILAFSLRNTAKTLELEPWVVGLTHDLPIGLLPALSFLVASGIAFATGTSWGTMGILIPIALPLAARLTEGQPDAALILLLTAASILDGAIFGDHCSLISDTTLMSSAACECPVVDHFRTQLPYTLPPMAAATLPGYLLLGLAPEVPWFAAFGLGLVLCAGVIVVLGKRPDAPIPVR